MVSELSGKPDDVSKVIGRLWPIAPKGGKSMVKTAFVRINFYWYRQCLSEGLSEHIGQVQ